MKNFIKKASLALSGVLGAIILSASLAPAGQTALTEDWNGDIPPVEYMGPAKAHILFAHPDIVHLICKKNQEDAGVTVPDNIRIIACAGQTGPSEGVILMPEPCDTAAWDPYAKILCHEKAHLNGWRHE